MWKLGWIYLASLLRGCWSYLPEYVSRTSGCGSWRPLVILCGCLTRSVPFRRREIEASSHYSLCAPMPEEAPWEVQSCKTLSGQYWYDSNRWCYWTFFPITKHPKMILRQLNVVLLDGVISEELWAGRALFSSQSPTSGPWAPSTAQQNDQGAGSVPGTSSHRATAQVSVEPPLPAPWESPLCNVRSRVKAPTQAPASTDKPLACFPAGFWVMPGRTVAGRAQASCPDWCRQAEGKSQPAWGN